MINVSNNAARAGYGQPLPQEAKRHDGDINVELLDHLVKLDVPGTLSRLFVVGKLIEFAAGGYRILGTTTSAKRVKMMPHRWCVCIDPKWVKEEAGTDE